MIARLLATCRQLRMVATGLFTAVVVTVPWVTSPPVTVGLLAAGTLLVLAGLGLRAWAAGHLTKMSSLTTSGPFAYVRNPLYQGSLLAAAGLCLASQWAWSAALLPVVYLVFYLPTVFHEEGLLRRTFGGDYERYAAAVPRFRPRLRPSPECARRGFQWQLLRSNREHRTAVTTLLPLALLWLRLLAPGGLGAIG